MAKLTVKTPGITPGEIELQPGVNKIGRAFSNDFQISAPSVSSHHCEIHFIDGLITVKDLGSTNGTFIDHQKIVEATFASGQTLRLGDIELTHESAIAAKPSLRVAAPPPAPFFAEATNLPLPPPQPAALPRQAAFVPSSRPKQPKNFYKNIPGAFAYPFKKNGLILLVSGTIFFGLINLARLFTGFFVGGGMGAFATGYLFTFMQSIISSSALGDEDMPLWPDYLNFWDSGLLPALEFFGLMLITLGPAILVAIFAQHEWRLLSIPLFILGAIYLPMAMLAVTLYDSLVALNPMTVLISMARAPLEYTVLCLMLGLLLTLSYGLAWLVETYLDTAMLPVLINGFLSLYFMTVQMRLLGLLYYSKREQLGWGFK